MKRARNHVRGGFTLIEAMIAVTVIALAGSVLLLASDSATMSASDTTDRMIAVGMARQLMDEALGQRYMEFGVTPFQTHLGPSGAERAGDGRERYDDSDDYHGFSASGPEDLFGKKLGTGDGLGGLRHPNFRVATDYFQNWRQRVQVYYVDATDPSKRLTGGATSNFRAVHVTIERDNHDGSVTTLAELRQVYAYVADPGATGGAVAGVAN